MSFSDYEAQAVKDHTWYVYGSKTMRSYYINHLCGKGPQMMGVIYQYHTGYLKAVVEYEDGRFDTNSIPGETLKDKMTWVIATMGLREVRV